MAHEAENSVNPESSPPILEFATELQLSVLHAEASSLYEKAKDSTFQTMFSHTTIGFNESESIATYRHGQHAAIGQYRDLAIQLYGPRLLITETSSNPQEWGRELVTRAMVIDAEGVSYMSEGSVSEEDSHGFRRDAKSFVCQVAYETHDKVPKSYAERTQGLIDDIWVPPQNKSRIWRRILS